MNGPGFDVKEAIEKNSYTTSISELERRGRRQVKVIKASLIHDLVREAVETVRQRAGLSEAERNRLLEESKIEFNRLLKEQQSHKQRCETLEETNANYERMISDLNRQSAEVSDSLKAETSRCQELMQEKQRLLEASQSTGSPDEVAALRSDVAELDGLRRQVASQVAETDRLREQAAEAETLRLQVVEIPMLREQVAEIDPLKHRIAVLEAELAETRRALADRDAVVEQVKRSEEQEQKNTERLQKTIEKQESDLVEADRARQEREENRQHIAELTAELKAMRHHQPAADTLVAELREMRLGIEKLETRNRELEEKATAATAVSSDAIQLEQILEKKLERITADLSAKLHSLKHGGGTDPADIKSAIQQVFSADFGADVESNLDELKVKEKETSGIASTLKRLKGLSLKDD